MFYRRKILLALLEAFGGSLAKTDCQKLLFLFCARREKNYYDFFPYKYGNFSLILAQDGNRLADLGLLSSHSDFQLQYSQQYVAQLETKDRATLQTFVEEIGDLRGEELIHKVYLDFPHYASRSQIAKKVLNNSEYEQVSSTWNSDRTPCLFTIGYEGLSVDAYLNLLVSNNVSVLVDVRKNPISMKYGFSKAKLTDYTQLAGISYIHAPDLGISSDLRKDLKSPAAYQRLFDFYSSQILPNQREALEKLQTIICENERVAITCFEADHLFCHRHRITEYLEHDQSFHIPVVHLNKYCVCDENPLIKPITHGLLEENILYLS